MQKFISTCRCSKSVGWPPPPPPPHLKLDRTLELNIDKTLSIVVTLRERSFRLCQRLWRICLMVQHHLVLIRGVCAAIESYSMEKNGLIDGERHIGHFKGRIAALLGGETEWTLNHFLVFLLRSAERETRLLNRVWVGYAQGKFIDARLKEITSFRHNWRHLQLQERRIHTVHVGHWKILSCTLLDVFTTTVHMYMLPLLVIYHYSRIHAKVSWWVCHLSSFTQWVCSVSLYMYMCIYTVVGYLWLCWV